MMSLSTAYLRAIGATNQTGLATRAEYELAFGAVGRETRNWLVGQVSLYIALQSVGLEVAGVPTVGMHTPDAALPSDLRGQLLQLNEVVEATGTQVLEMRESGGYRTPEFTTAARMDSAITMVALGDVYGTKVRDLAWTRLSDKWVISSDALRQAGRHGLRRSFYSLVADDHPGLLPPAASDEVTAITAGRSEEQFGDDSRCWIKFSEVVQLIKSRL